jgi:hypothetical protein
MADLGARGTARDAVVRPLSRAAVRPCARPGCPSPARATLSFRYASREAWVEPLGDEAVPATYDLCASHADRTRPPHGWRLVDHRPDEDQATATGLPADLGGERTVAVLAAALRAVPDTPEAAPAPPDPDEVRDALAELQAVARVDRDELAASPDPAVSPAHAASPEPAAGPEPLPEPLPAPRPVLAARDSARPGDGRARAW